MGLGAKQLITPMRPSDIGNNNNNKTNINQYHYEYQHLPCFTSQSEQAGQPLIACFGPNGILDVLFHMAPCSRVVLGTDAS